MNAGLFVIECPQLACRRSGKLVEKHGGRGTDSARQDQMLSILR